VATTQVYHQPWANGDFTVHTFDLNTSGSPDASYPEIWAANQAYVSGGQLVAPAESSTTGWRFAGVSARNFATGSKSVSGAVEGGPSSGGKIVTRATFASAGFSGAFSSFAGYFVPLISVYGGNSTVNANETPNNVAFQVQFYDVGASDVGISLIYSDVVNGSGSIFGGAFDETQSGFTIPKASLEGNTFDVTLTWCNCSADHTMVTNWMTVGGSPSPTADGYVRLMLGATEVYHLTNKAIVTFWWPGFPDRLNLWNKLSTGMSGLPGPIDFVTAYHDSCVEDLLSPPDDVTSPCCCTCPTEPGSGTAPPPSPPPPDNPIEYGVTDECDGDGLGPTGTNPSPGEMWLY
jgi:hypothetical protein